MHARQCLVPLSSVLVELVAATLSLIVQERVSSANQLGHIGEGTNHRTGPRQVNEEDSRC